MHVEPSRDPERHAAVWPGVPANLRPREALEFWEKTMKPKNYILDRWVYNPQTGSFQTVGTTKL